MKKRIVCVLLTLIMLMSLVPVSASAAAMSISESAITVLKQLEGYTTTCNANGITGYGTKCTETGTHGSHKITEKLADGALRKDLAALSTAINTFASQNGVALTQGQHDALVLFSFENGTAWTAGTGDLKGAVTSRKTGSDFLSAICRWDASTNDDTRRMIEANMYLNGVYSSARPSSFIRAIFDPNSKAYSLHDGTKEEYFGTINENTTYQYYDVSGNPAPHLVPSMDNHTFVGWYIETSYGWEKVTNLNSSHHGKTLVASWVPTYSIPGTTKVSYVIRNTQLANLGVYRYSSLQNKFTAVAGKYASSYFFTENALLVDSDYLDESGNRWCRISGEDYWVLVTGVGASASVNTAYIDVTVTVTNSYVRSRVNADIQSAQNGSYSKGDKLRIINTDSADGFLWGQVAKSETDNTPIGWVALMYTDFESVRNNTGNTTSTNTGTAIATAVITYNGYVNVRSEAGTGNRIVSALPKGTEVSLYETKFVNGLEWGRCSIGWFCLTYASVERLTVDNSYATDLGFTTYVFTGEVNPYSVEIYEQPSTSANRIFTRQLIDKKVTVSNFVNVGGVTWGKIKEGWIQVSDADGRRFADIGVDLYTVKFQVAGDSLAVREKPDTASERVDLLIKGTEFNINESYQIMVVGDSIWGYATKVGENNRTYQGWVNLANANVTRNEIPTVSTGTSTGATTVTGLLGTVINASNLKVRTTGATYAQVIGTLAGGTTVAVWETNEDKSWYKVDSNQNGVYDYDGDGWVSGSYLNVYEGTISGDTSSSGATNSGSTTGTVETGMGVVANTYSGVNVRQGAGTGYALVGKLLPGTAVEILEVVTRGATKWGRTEKGWVSMDYIAMVNNYIPNGSTGSASGSTTTESETAIYTGTTKAQVTVYKETSQKSDAVRVLAAGEPVTMHELLTVVEYENKTVGSTDSNEGSTTTVEKKTSYWARVNDGYIYAPGDNINLDTVNEYTYTSTGEVKALNNPGSGTVLFKLTKSQQVAVTEMTIVNSNVWGKVECEGSKGELQTGWVSLASLVKGAGLPDTNTGSSNNNTGTNTGSNTGNVGMGNGSSTGGFVTNTTGYRYTGTVIRTNSLNVRNTPSQTAPKTTTLKNGQALVIYETTTAENMAWGRCDAGWVYLYYVDLVPVTGAVDAQVVYTDNTVIYSDVNATSVVGTYARMSVVDIYEIVGKMARTELGWVHTDNIE